MGLKDRAGKTVSERWETALDQMARSTRSSYVRELGQFLDWADETKESLIAYWVDIRDDPTRNMGLSDAVNDYLYMLDDKGYRGGKQFTAAKAVRFFFRCNGFTPVIDFKERPKGDGAKRASLDEVRRILAFGITNPKIGAIAAITKDSGLRVSDIVRIQFKHIQPIIDDPELEWHCFKIKVWKTRAKNRKALPCLGVDSITSIREWKKGRESYGAPCGPEDYVFINTRFFSEYESSGQKRSGSLVGNRMTAANASIGVQNLCERAGLDLSANSLRKFNSTILTLSDMKAERVKIMHGKHQLSSLDSYVDAETHEMLEVYKRFYHLIAINQVDPESERIIQELQEQVKGMVTQEQLAAHTAKITMEVLRNLAQVDAYRPNKTV